MQSSLRISFLDFGTMGPGIDPTPIERFGEVTYFSYTSPRDIQERVGACDVIVCNKTALTADVLRQAQRARLIVLAATGTDNVDLDESKRLGIAVYNIRNYCTPSVAQHVFALILGLTHRVTGFHALVNSGAWSQSDTFCLFDYPIRELAGKKLGLVGCGALGKGVKRVAEGFGMEVLVSARRNAVEIPQGRMPFADVLREADVLSLHCPLVPDTRNLIGPDQLRAMKKDALLINTARGGLVDAGALVSALQNQQIGGAGIDVLDSEPPPHDHPLVAASLDNLILTPHVAWAAREARQRAIEQMAGNIEDFLDGQTGRRVV